MKIHGPQNTKNGLIQKPPTHSQCALPLLANSEVLDRKLQILIIVWRRPDTVNMQIAYLRFELHYCFYS